ncbi:hypothetical protein SLITO_v1c04430 [Spiroplasma litorale]|uniref:Uncharacterized protein n=1 Tax=Spiroplasma litorale TaxID=216942 RepID=A0A0K1W1N7_9MOLU|nr:hypothetical protein [Spiroplasma litorale]AKX34096.1 hypothetical protein SLITO_v1c04430 [Spiroplasma litorale]
MKEKKENLFKDYKKIIRKYVKFIPLVYMVFIIDVLVFYCLVALFITNRIIEKDFLSWAIIAACLYTIFRFSFVNWFQKNKYYKKIVVFDFKDSVAGQGRIIKREICFNSINFWVILVIINFTTAIFVNYEVSTFLTNQKIMLAVTNTSLNMLLLPSFISTFQKIGQTDKNVASNYINLVKDQYFSNKSLFENVEFEKNFLNLKFTKNDLVSKNGIFVLINKDDLKQKEIDNMKKINDVILKNYREIWESYYKFLKEKNNIKVSKLKMHSQYWIERIYDHIFIDFFDV